MDDACFELDVQQLMVGYLRDFQQTLSELESSFRDIEDSKEIIKGALQAAGKFYAADRAYVLEIDMDLHIGVNTYEWCSEDAPVELIHSQLQMIMAILAQGGRGVARMHYSQAEQYLSTEQKQKILEKLN